MCRLAGIGEIQEKLPSVCKDIILKPKRLSVRHQRMVSPN